MKINSLSKHRIKKIIGCFASELTAIDTAQKLKIHRNTVNKYYRFIRESIASYQHSQYEIFLAEHPSPEKFYIGWHRNLGLTLNPQPDTIHYHLSVEGRHVFVGAEVEGQTPTGAVLSEGQQQEAANNLSNDNVVSYFYNYAKSKLTKFYGVRPQYVDLYIRELEFRFNNQETTLAPLIWKIVSQKPISLEEGSETTATH